MKEKFLFTCIVVLCPFLLLYPQKQYINFQSGNMSAVEKNTLPARDINSSTDDGICLEYRFSGACISGKEAEGINYDLLNIEGLGRMIQPGVPSLPVLRERIALPKGAEPLITIVRTEFSEHNGFLIYPAMEQSVDTEGAPEPEFVRDEKIYATDAFYPEKITELVTVGEIRKTNVATIEIRPVQFNPLTRTIRTYSKIVIQIEFKNRQGSFANLEYENSKHSTDVIKRLVLNSARIPDGVKNEVASKRSDARNYIIITHSAYMEAAQLLAGWKEQLGYSTEIVARSLWTAPEIKAEIANRYHSWTPKPDYFVIIGDHDGPNAVPGEMHLSPNGSSFATDLYYACMDGGSDHYPDMAHGRISVSNSEEALRVVHKIINYEQNPPDQQNFYDHILNCAQYQDTDNNGYADCRFCHTSEEIRDYLQDNYGYLSTRVYNTTTTANKTTLRYNNAYFSDGQLLPAELRSNSFNWDGDAEDIIREINNGQFLVFHRDHGYIGGSGWSHPELLIESLPGMQNGDMLPVVLSMNCHTGEFQLEKCFAEEFIRMKNKGAVGVVAAAYYSYSGLNDALSEGIIDAIWSDPGLYPDFGTAGNGGTYTVGAGNELYTMGDVLNQGLYAMVQNYYDNRYSYEVYHYFGDPAMKIWTSNPNLNIISAIHSQELSCTDSVFTISGSEPGALACFVFNEELIAKTRLDSSGNGILVYHINQQGNVLLTISRHNCIPYITTITQDCPGSPPSLLTFETHDYSDQSAVLSGEIVNNNGSAVAESGFVLSTSPEPVIGAAGVIQVQTAPIVGSGEYSIEIGGLSGANKYYYRAYALNANGTAYGDEKDFETLCSLTDTLPFSEGFEGGCLPECWDYDGSEWYYADGVIGGNPSSAHNGSFCALFYNMVHPIEVSKLISPQIDMNNYSSASLKFWHTQAVWSWTGNHDELCVYYKNHPDSSWNLLAAYTDPIESWTLDSIELPALSNSYFIAFEATGNYGYTIGIDDIEISGTYAPSPEINLKQGANTILCDGYYNFGDVHVNTGSVVDFTIENTGNDALLINNITSSNGLFSLSGIPISVAAGNSEQFSLSFDPCSTGDTTALIKIFSNDTDEGEYTFTAAGYGICDNAVIDSIGVSATGICPGENVVLHVYGELNGAAAWHFFEGICGGNEFASNSSGEITVAPIHTTSYFVSALGGCITDTVCMEAVISVNDTYPVIDSLTATNNNICPGESTRLIITGELNNASEWHFFEGACGENQIISNTSGEITVAPMHTTSYFASALGGCCTDTICEEITIIVKDTYPVIDSLTASNKIICTGETTTLTITGSLNNADCWYLFEGSCGGQAIDSTMGGTFIVSPEANTSYYISGLGDCTIDTICAGINISIDNEGPVPDVDVLPVLQGECEVIVTDSPSATDYCSGSVTGTTTDPVSYFNQGTYTINWIYEDADGNITSQQQTVKVEDVTNPEIMCPSDTSVYITGSSAYIVTDQSFDLRNLSDNCSVSTVTNNHNMAESLLGAEFEAGETEVEWLVSDIAGNTTGCMFLLKVVNLTAINKNDFENIKIYPNPGNGIYQVQLPYREAVRAYIADVVGRLVYETHISNNQCIDISGFENGLYILYLDTKNGIYTIKLIKE